MAFRADRRRRLLSEEHGVVDADQEPEVAVRPARRPAYLDGALGHHSLRLIDCLPLKTWTLATVILLGGCLAGGLGYLSTLVPASPLPNHDELAALLHPGCRASLANWFASLTWGVVGVQAAIVFTVRRQRLDDYHARYRVWVSAALLCLLASAGQIVPYRIAGETALGMISPWASLSGATLWKGVVGLLLTVFGVRLVLEMRRASAALAMLGTSLGLFALASWGPSLLAENPESAAGMALATSARLWGQFLLSATLGLYALHILSEAQGGTRSRTRPARAKRKSSPEPESAPKMEKPIVRPAEPEEIVPTTAESAPAQLNLAGMSRDDRKKFKRQMRRHRDAA